jgi:hypothetical protein
MRKACWFVLLGIALGVTSGCGTVRIARPDHWNPDLKGSTNYFAANNAYTVTSPATDAHQTNVWIKWWGIKQINIDPREDGTDALSEVKVKTNFGSDLLSVLTLGCVQRVTIQWRSAKPPQSQDQDF